MCIWLGLFIYSVQCRCLHAFRLQRRVLQPLGPGGRLAGQAVSDIHHPALGLRAELRLQPDNCELNLTRASLKPASLFALECASQFWPPSTVSYGARQQICERAFGRASVAPSGRRKVAVSAAKGELAERPLHPAGAGRCGRPAANHQHSAKASLLSKTNNPKRGQQCRSVGHKRAPKRLAIMASEARPAQNRRSCGANLAARKRNSAPSLRRPNGSGSSPAYLAQSGPSRHIGHFELRAAGTPSGRRNRSAGERAYSITRTRKAARSQANCPLGKRRLVCLLASLYLGRWLDFKPRFACGGESGRLRNMVAAAAAAPVERSAGPAAWCACKRSPTRPPPLSIRNGYLSFESALSLARRATREGADYATHKAAAVSSLFANETALVPLVEKR